MIGIFQNCWAYKALAMIIIKNLFCEERFLFIGWIIINRSISNVLTDRFILLDRNIPPFYACLKDERDLWFTLISEISAAQKNSFALKDKKLIDQGKSNVILGLALLELQYPLKTAEGNV